MRIGVFSFLALFSRAATVAEISAAMAENMARPDPSAPLAPTPLPSPGPARDSGEIIKQLMTLSRANIDSLKLVKKVEFEGDLWEPEGIVRLSHPSNGDEERFWVSAGEYTTPTVKYPGGEWRDGTDRSAGEGFAHFVVFDGEGKRLGDWVVSEEGDIEYHNGGLDYDGQHIWATLSQYRPNTTATVVRIDPVKLEMERVLRVRDHQGGIVRDTEKNTLTTLSWGGRKARLWSLDERALSSRDEQQPLTSASEEFSSPRKEVVNPSYWIDYQDCKFLGYFEGRPVMLCSGIATLALGVDVGGLAIVDAETMVPVWEVPFMERTAEGKRVLMTKNPMDVALVGGKLRLFFLPEEGTSTLYVYELSG
ncbi:uncharacterized protein CTRU02_207818 [Colletotrichum truncatum]|uniref:Uncharacterized protein n=1 Tax=Colletotrichum truncatum TaxID=5467 RepID=A0ACC3Z1W8_COLTU|nr:uncharacterized protein CTRU02_15162 [Colletotrichum truncatum]KAF6781379.1 hypothetical protein CTRU02_15162 [Colletotrichum truncatum]